MSDESTKKFPTPEETVLTDVGPCLHEEGVTYRIWAMGHESVVVNVEKADGDKYTLALEPAKDSGYFFGIDPQGAAGDLYTVSIDGLAPVPDFVSHYQPRGVGGSSMIVDAGAHQWQATEWKRPAWNGQVIYECHLGTFTPEGTYRSAIEKLDYLVWLGITALEIMPVAEFAGERNWGYDGVLLFAPTHAYGTPNDFRALIDACHLRGLAVILDIVYNHLGPEGNFSHQYSDFFFHEGKDNPWGQNFNLDGPNSAPVRNLLRQNARYWLDEFRIDGFRMDATHMVHDESTVHILAEIAEIVHSRGGFITAEDDRNARSVLEPRNLPGAWGFDGLWSDDFHHSLRVSQTGEREHFLAMVDGSAGEIADIMRKGWLYSGQYSAFHQQPRGTPADDFPPQAFVFCISNHDQVGNRWQGARLHESIDGAGYRALSLFLCLVPYTPLIFMGQEWGASAPFHYFTDMSDELGGLIVKGRGEEFIKMNFVKDRAELKMMKSPQESATLEQSKIDWEERGSGLHAGLLALYKQGLDLRRELFGRVNPPRHLWSVESESEALTIRYNLGKRKIAVHFRIKDGTASPIPTGTILLRSNAPEFAGHEPSGHKETLVIEES